jgi:hypothetical protein
MVTKEEILANQDLTDEEKKRRVASLEDTNFNQYEQYALQSLKTKQAKERELFPEQLADLGLKGWGGVGTAVGEEQRKQSEQLTGLVGQLGSEATNRRMAEASLTGYYKGAPTTSYELARQAQDATNAYNEANLTGSFKGAPTIAKLNLEASQKAQKDTMWMNLNTGLIDMRTKGQISEKEYKSLADYYHNNIYGAGTISELPSDIGKSGDIKNNLLEWVISNNPTYESVKSYFHSDIQPLATKAINELKAQSQLSTVDETKVLSAQNMLKAIQDFYLNPINPQGTSDMVRKTYFDAIKAGKSVDEARQIAISMQTKIGM